MIINLKGADAEFTRLSKLLASERQRVAESKLIEMVHALKDETPVDTGRARDNWEYELKDGKAIIRNDTPYIEDLNHGSSKQAPAFFVEKTLLKHGKPLGQIVQVTPS